MIGAQHVPGVTGRVMAERLEAEYTGASRAVMKRSLLDQLDKMVKFDLPGKLVEAEASQIAHQLWHEEHPEEHGHNHGTVEATEEHKTLAERRVRLGQYPGQERQYFEFVQKNQQVQQQLRAPIFEDKVIDHIVAQAKVTEKEVSKDKLQKAVEALDEL